MATAHPETVSVRTDKPAAKALDGMLLVDLGKRSRKQIKRLRKGEGKLVGEVQRCVHELRSAGTLADSSQPVLVLVREKRPRYDWF